MPFIRRPLQRELRSDSLPSLPSEIIEYILSFISPSQLVASGWSRVSQGFGDLIVCRVKKSSKVDVTQDAELYDFFKPTISCSFISSFPVQERLLRLLSRNFFPHITELAVPIGFFAHLHSVSQSGAGALRSVEKLSLKIGGEYGPLTVAKQHFDHLSSAKTLFGSNTLQEINMEVVVADGEGVTCCGIRELIRFMREVVDASTVWNLKLVDWTLLGQGWFGPADLTRYRNQAFVCYLRTLIDLGVRVNTLALVDERKPSPYMLIMRGSKHRAMYMYPEFKNCRSLFIRYDVGVVAPTFAHEGDRFDRIETVDLAESHVLYKGDLLQYFRNAPNLNRLRVILPASWLRRTSGCSLKCFENADFSCFRADGWCLANQLLPNVQFSIS